MKAKGIVNKISTAVKNEIREKWMNLDKDSKLEYKKEARENFEKSIKLDRDFCKWLVDHFDHNSCALDICGRRLPISIEDVEFILGIKSSGVDVSIVASAEEINHICQQHGLNVVGDIRINLLEGSDEAICKIEQSITSLGDEMLVMQKTMKDITNNMMTLKNDIVLELKKTAREHTGYSNDLNLNDIVDVKKEMKSTSPYIIQDTMDQDDTVCAKKESKIESTSPIQDKMELDDT
ncbi:hypothetical protein SO802_030357 [Lithocarpus litseifolius]|uniref:Uncharacterized protein n=1 Tax=Lithocarpus litseifolius TaxID=425828 RepID=A0AAW2BJF4_9ROSI